MPSSNPTVDPDEQVTFSFTGKIRSDASPGTHNVYFTPVYDGDAINHGWETPFSVEITNPTPTATTFTKLTGKFDGNSYTDVCVFEQGVGDWWVSLRDPNSNRFIKNTTAWITDFGDNGDYTPLVGNFGGPGSGLDDIIILDRSLGRWFVAYNQNGSFEREDGTQTGDSWLDDWGKDEDGTYTPLIGDFNNDNYYDLCLYEQVSGNWYVALRDQSENRFVPSYGPWTEDYGDGVGSYQPITGNFGGDGKFDIGLYYPASGNWYIAINTGSEFERNGTWLTDFGDNGTYQALTGQFRGDVKTDIGLYQPSTGDWFMARSDGDEFTKLNGPESYGAWITDFGDAVDEYRPLVGYFSWDSYVDIGLYQPEYGRWFVATNDGSPDRFTRTNGPYTLNSWLTGWGVEQGGSPKLAGEEHQLSLPESYLLHQNYPNPFNPVTTISYNLPTASHVTLDIFNILGQKVETLVDESQEAGEYTVTWATHQHASGIYFYRLATGNAVETRKMVLLK